MVETAWAEINPQPAQHSLTPEQQIAARQAHYREAQAKADAEREAGTERREKARREVEASRLAQRERIKQQKRDALAQGERLTKIDTLIAGCESRKESFATSHCEACRPLQEQLRALEGQGLEDSPEYAELRSSVDEFNGRLKSAIEREDKRIHKLQAERITVAAACFTSTLDAQLIRQYGNPALVKTLDDATAVANALKRFGSEIACRLAGIAQREAQEAYQAVIDE